MGDPDDLFETLSQALLASVDRDAYSGWGAVVHIITKDGVTSRKLKVRQDLTRIFHSHWFRNSTIWVLKFIFFILSYETFSINRRIGITNSNSSSLHAFVIFLSYRFTDPYFSCILDYPKNIIYLSKK